VRAGVPMLPLRHGGKHTQLQLLLYPLHLFGASLLLYVASMSGPPYHVAALILGGVFLVYPATLRRLQR
jgi:protoheme IX farnesyltransferase